MLRSALLGNMHYKGLSEDFLVLFFIFVRGLDFCFRKQLLRGLFE